jgi:uncharacterized SAM-binding protein YcdF (DUF218 family)
MHVILSPLGLSLLLLACLAIATRLPRQRRPLTRLSLLGLAGCVLLMTPWGANQLVRMLESQWQGATCTAFSQAPIVLLTGGLDRQAADSRDFSALTPVSARRAWGLIRTGTLAGASDIWVTGGIPTGQVSESELLAQLLQAMGVPTTRIHLEQHARNTQENARHLAQLVPGKRIVLVTSALHMTRAREIFSTAGFDICPLAVDPIYVAPGGLGYYLPQSSALIKSEKALHEWVGLMAFRFMQFSQGAR